MEYRDARLVAARGGKFGRTSLTKVPPCHVFSLILLQNPLTKTLKYTIINLSKERRISFMTEKNSKIINTLCIAAKLLNIPRDEILKSLMHTTAVKESSYNEVLSIVNSYFNSEEV
mgnify:CR=1 FL=1